MGAESPQKAHARCNLGRVLTKNGISQARLADATSIAQPQLNRVVNGFNYPTVASVLRILDGLEHLTGKRFDVRELWERAETKRLHPRTHRVA